VLVEGSPVLLFSRGAELLLGQFERRECKSDNGVRFTFVLKTRGTTQSEWLNIKSSASSGLGSELRRLRDYDGVEAVAKLTGQLQQAEVHKLCGTYGEEFGILCCVALHSGRMVSNKGKAKFSEKAGRDMINFAIAACHNMKVDLKELRVNPEAVIKRLAYPMYFKRNGQPCCATVYDDHASVVANCISTIAEIFEFDISKEKILKWFMQVRAAQEIRGIKLVPAGHYLPLNKNEILRVCQFFDEVVGDFGKVRDFLLRLFLGSRVEEGDRITAGMITDCVFNQRCTIRKNTKGKHIIVPIGAALLAGEERKQLETVNDFEKYREAMAELEGSIRYAGYEINPTKFVILKGRALGVHCRALRTTAASHLCFESDLQKNSIDSGFLVVTSDAIASKLSNDKLTMQKHYEQDLKDMNGGGIDNMRLYYGKECGKEFKMPIFAALCDSERVEFLKYLEPNEREEVKRVTERDGNHPWFGEFCVAKHQSMFDSWLLLLYLNICKKRSESEFRDARFKVRAIFCKKYLKAQKDDSPDEYI
jgi:hypothetical protein